MVEVDGRRSSRAGFDIRKRSRRRHMWSVPSSATTSPPSQRPLIPPSLSSPNSCFLKDGREISVGECALFKLAHDSPTLVGIIRSLTSDKGTCEKISVNWLYRPAEVKLVKGVALEAAPNEVFYTFHRGEIPAASFLHRCKVAFLPRVVELPAGVSSFVCRRVYDITNSCLWWLTDKDYIDERQEEVDQLLHKTVVEMHVSVEHQLDPRSPKAMNGSAATSPQKHSPDSLQNSGSNFSSQSKGKKRDRGDQSSEPIKRERSIRTDNGDSGQLRSDSMRNLEITKLTEKGLVCSDAVARLLRLMQPEKSRRKIDLSERTMLAGIIAATDKHDCLTQFVQLKGVPVLDEWLQDVHKGRFGESGNIKYSDKVVEDFLLVLLGALDKLPVNLSALQMCNIGKSVNHLRSHKNSEIQKKARSLVDTWKKRVEAEMNISDCKGGSSQAVPWPGRLRDGSHGGNKHSGGSSEAAIRCAAPHQSSPKSSSVKTPQGDSNSKPGSAYQTNARSALSPAPSTLNYKDPQIRTTNGGSVDIPQTVIKEEKSCSSSQSHTNSQCSTDHVRSRVPHGKEDARKSTAASKCFNKFIDSGSKHKNSANGAILGVNKESISSRSLHVGRTSLVEKVSPNPVDGSGQEANNQKHIVKSPNRCRGSAQSGVGASVDDISCKNSRASSPAVSEKHDQSDACLRRKQDSHEFDEVDSSSAAVPPRPSDTRKLPSTSKSACAPCSNENKLRKTHDSTFSSMNALVESCVKFSEANALMAAGDDIGMNLLASVAAGEICGASSVSPTASPHKNSKSSGNSDGNDRTNEKELHDGVIDQGKSTDVDSDNFNIASGAPKVNVEDCTKHVKIAEGVPQNEEGCLRNKGVSGEQVGTACTAASNVADVGAKVCSDKGGNVTGDSHIQRPAAPQAVGSDVEVKDKVKNTSVIDDTVKKAYQDSVFPPVDGEEDVKSSVFSVPKNDCSVEQNSGVVMLKSGSQSADDKQTVHHPAAVLSTSKSENVPGVHIRDFAGDSVKKRFDQENGSSEWLEKLEDLRVHSPVAARDTDCKLDNLDMKEATVQQLRDSSTQVSSSGDVIPEELHLSTKEVNVVAFESEAKGDCAAGTVDAILPPAAGGLVVDAKLGFDLNEGLNSDDGKCSESVSSCPVDICSANPLQVPVSSAGNVLVPVAVSAPAKGSFVPHVDLLKNKELGWKGSAANSAFRLVEPRNVVELPPGPSKALRPVSAASNQVRLPLDIDLNVADESYDEEFDSKYNSVSELTAATPLRGCGVLDLDLNKADEASDSLHQSASNSQRLDASAPSAKQLPSISFFNAEVNGRRGFDLNNGPAVEELPFEQTSQNQPFCSNIPLHPNLGPRITCSDVGNLFPWYPPGTSYSVSMTPSASHDRQAFPVVGMGGGPHRIMGGPTSSLPFNPDALSGSVLSSSPAMMPFQSAAFQYPVFPFGTSFPVHTSAVAGGPSGYVDAAATGRITGFPSQLAANAGAVSFQYPHSYVISRPDINCNGTIEANQKCGRQGLDLNSGPGFTDLEARIESLPAVSRQVSIISSQPLVEEQARMYGLGGGALKRKEPEGGWSADKFNSRESWWR